MKHDQKQPTAEEIKLAENFNKFVGDAIQYAALIKPPEVPEHLTKNLPAHAVITMACLIVSICGARAAGMPESDFVKTVQSLYQQLKIEQAQ